MRVGDDHHRPIRQRFEVVSLEGAVGDLLDGVTLELGDEIPRTIMACGESTLGSQM